MLSYVTGLILVGVSVLLLMIFTYGLLHYYKEKSVSFIYSISIYITWFLAFIGIILYPIDIGYSIERQEANPKILTMWNIVYWVTFFLAWVYIPIMMEYWASGEFKPASRFREALWVNAKFYIWIVVIGGIAGVWFFLVSDISFASLQGWIIGISNTYGLCFVVLLLGVGLVELPVNLWQRRDYHRELSALYKKCYSLDSEKYEYEFKVVSMKTNVRELKKTLESAKKSPFILKTINDMLLSMPSDEEISLHRHSSSIIDKSEWVNMTLLECLEKSDNEIISILSRLNSQLKKTCLVYQRKVCQYEECVDSIVAIHNAIHEPIIDPKNGQEVKYTLEMTKWSHWCSTVWNTIRYPVLTFLSLLSGLFSIVILMTELTTIISHYIHKNLSIFGISITSLHNSLLRTLAAAVPLLYIFICYFRSFFLFKIPFVESYHLYYHHTDVYALSFNAYYLCRLQFSLCYHFFTLLQMDEHAYQSIALSSILGQMKTIPFLGNDFNFYMPCILFLISVVTFFQMVIKKKQNNRGNEERLISGKMDDERFGRELVVVTLKRRDHQRLDQQMSRERHSNYNYHSPIVSIVSE